MKCLLYVILAFVCISFAFTSQVKAWCYSDTDCGECYWCSTSNGSCNYQSGCGVTTCTSSTQCTGDQKCIGGTCTTIDTSVCTSDSQCSECQRCQAGACTNIPGCDIQTNPGGETGDTGGSTGCTWDGQCGSNERCSGGTCESIPAPPPNTGDPSTTSCSLDSDCDTGKYCVPYVNRCADFTGSPLVCPEGTYIDLYGGMTCKPLVAEGGVCQSLGGIMCQSGVCLGGVCKVALPNGAACQSGIQCASGYCNPKTLTCNNASVGSPCNGVDTTGVYFCNDNLTCNCLNDFNDSCTCQPRLKLGSTCSWDNQCNSGFCHGNACALPGTVPLNQFCTNDNQCASGICDTFMYKACVCEGNGSTCAKDASCCSGSCVNGFCRTTSGTGGSTDSGTTCGNGSCGNGEDCESCSSDCGACTAGNGSCGDNVCRTNEDCSTCAQDCGTCSVDPNLCGNNTCDTGETAQTCPSDCTPASELNANPNPCQLINGSCQTTITWKTENYNDVKIYRENDTVSTDTSGTYTDNAITEDCVTYTLKSSTNVLKTLKACGRIATAWIKIRDGAFQSKKNITNTIPETVAPYDTSDDNSRNFISGEGGSVIAPSINLGNGKTNSNDWKTLRNPRIYFDKSKAFNYTLSRKEYKTITSLSTGLNSDGIYIYNGNATLTDSPSQNSTIVIIINGTVTISGNIAPPTDKSLAIIADSILIDPSVSELKGFYFADSIDTGAGNGLKITGNLIARTLINKRSQPNNTSPSIYIVFDAETYLQLLPYISIRKYTYKQLN